ncbi:MAG: hypothetical protein IPF93_14710 [Saprospiraceae bacterium]|nr:hypothetical protein [Saprospiraceae bacterium]
MLIILLIGTWCTIPVLTIYKKWQLNTKAMWSGLSGNEGIKPEYIDASLNAGTRVFADKPMIIRYEDFGRLKSSFVLAKHKIFLLARYHDRAL